MTEFKSEITSINSSDRVIYNFLNDFNNFEKLMPEQVINWQSTKENCSFTIKGMADLAMRMSKSDEFSFISYSSEGKSPFHFNLSFHIEKLDENKSDVYSLFSADLNPMIKMMASRPLKNFVNLLVEKLKVLLEAEN